MVVQLPKRQCLWSSWCSKTHKQHPILHSICSGIDLSRYMRKPVGSWMHVAAVVGDTTAVEFKPSPESVTWCAWRVSNLTWSPETMVEDGMKYDKRHIYIYIWDHKMGCSILRVRLEQRKLNFAKNKYKKTKNNKPIVKTDSPKNTPTGKNQQKKSPSEKQNHKNKLKINNTKSKLNVPNCFFCFVYVLFFMFF